MPSSNKRIHSIDLVEAIAIFFVLAYHSTFYIFDIVENGAALYYLRYFLRTILSTGVPLFFFANGFLLFHKDLNIKKHIKKIIHFIFIAVTWDILTMLILIPIKGEYFTPLQFIKALWGWKIGWTNHLWFLGSLVCIYILFPVLKFIHDQNTKLFLYFVVICGIFTFGNVFLNNLEIVFSTKILHLSQTGNSINFFNIFNPFGGARWYTFVYFCVGGLAFTYKDRILCISRKKRNLYAVCAILISCVLLWLLGICYSQAEQSMWDVVWNGYDTIPTFINVLAIFVLTLNCQRKNTIVQMVSTNTLGIYLIHIIFINLYINIIRPKVMTIPYLDTLWYSAVFSIMLIFVCVAVTTVIKKIPLIKHLIS